MEASIQQNFFLPLKPEKTKDQTKSAIEFRITQQIPNEAKTTHQISLAKSP